MVETVNNYFDSKEMVVAPPDDLQNKIVVQILDIDAQNTCEKEYQ